MLVMHQKESFQMHEALLWTIHDFLAYAVLSGGSTKGRYVPLSQRYA